MPDFYGIIDRGNDPIEHRSPTAPLSRDHGGVTRHQAFSGWSNTGSESVYESSDLIVMLDGWVSDEQRLGPVGRPLTDIECLAKAWLKWGTSLTSHIDGAFVAVLWDKRSATAHLIRDRMGIQRLYWSREGDRLYFATDLRQLIALRPGTPTLSSRSFAEFLEFGAVHAPNTILQGIQQLQAASWLRFDPSGVMIRPYWSPPYAGLNAPSPRSRDVVRDLRRALRASLEQRISGQQSAALLLSGGLGSTAIALAARDLDTRLPTWTVGFTDDAYPELPFAVRIAKLLGMEHHEVMVRSSDLADSFDDTVRAMAHPVGTPSALLQFLLGRAMGSATPVLLSGDGANELFGGRFLAGSTSGLRRSALSNRLPGPMGEATSLLLTGKWRTTNLVDFGLKRGLGSHPVFSPKSRTALMSRRDWVRPSTRDEVLSRIYRDLNTDPINAMLHAFSTSHLQEIRLARVRRIAVATGHDARFPWLDRRVVELAARLPGGYKAGYGGGLLRARWPLRAIVRGSLPQALVERPRRDPTAPLDRWLAGPGRLFLESRARKLQQRTALFNPDGVRKLTHDVGKRPGAGLQVWSLFILDAWLEQSDIAIPTR